MTRISLIVLGVLALTAFSATQDTVSGFVTWLCTSEVAQDPPPDKTPIVKTSNTTEKSAKPVVALENMSKSWWPFGKAQATTREDTPLLDPRKPEIKGPPSAREKNPRQPVGPILIPNVPEPKKVAANVVKVELPAPLAADELQKRIQSACPQVKSVEVQFTSAQDVRITLEILTENDLKSTAERVFALPELLNFRPEIQFKISTP